MKGVLLIMKKLTVKLLAGLMLLMAGGAVLAQTPDLALDQGVKPHAGIDAVYGTFSEAYRKLDAQMVTDLYSENAAYLEPDAPVKFGREEIKKIFAGFFDYTKNNGNNITISFRILRRKANALMGYDVGIYTIATFKDGQKISEGQGKFVVVAVKKGKVWQFDVDGYSGLRPPEKK
jgi:uncharacterized protein (TIGR02246 family)